MTATIQLPADLEDLSLIGVAYALASLVDESGVVSRGVTVSDIADRAGVSRRTAQRQLAALERAGHITREAQGIGQPQVIRILWVAHGVSPVTAGAPSRAPSTPSVSPGAPPRAPHPATAPSQAPEIEAHLAGHGRAITDLQARLSELERAQLPRRVAALEREHLPPPEREPTAVSAALPSTTLDRVIHAVRETGRAGITPRALHDLLGGTRRTLYRRLTEAREAGEVVSRGATLLARYYAPEHAPGEEQGTA